MADGVIITESAAKALVGKQWATFLFAGRSALGAVVDAMSLAEGRILWLELEAEEFPGLVMDDLGATPEIVDEPATLQLDWSGVRGQHINCEHDPAGLNTRWCAMGQLSKWRRRRPGIYLVRTRKHAGRTRENGYVGLSNNVSMRRLDHLGQGRYGHTAKPWTDLDPVWHVLKLPWWLGFRWTLAPIEYVAIRVLLPRYNVTHNLGNPRRVPPAKQRAQRAQRDAHGHVWIGARVVAWRPSILQIIGAAFVIASVAGMLHR